MNLLLCLLIPLFSLFFVDANAVARSEDPPWLVSIRTQNSSGAEVEGTGSIVKKNNRFYVVTASHVSQGDKLEILQRGKPLEVVGRLSDNFNDAEMFEVRKFSGNFANDEILASYDDKTRQFWVLHSLQMEKNQLLAAGEEVVLPLRIGIKNNPKEWQFYNAPHSGLGKWNASADGKAQPTLGGGELTSRMKISPGMSGSPLIGTLSDNGITNQYYAFENQGKLMFAEFALMGIATRYLCDFDRSYFTRMERVVDLMEKYEQGVRGSVDATHWKQKNGIPYRDLGDGTLETNFLSSVAGGGGSTDGGNTSKAMNPCDNPATYQGIIWKDKPTVAFRMIPKDKRENSQPVVVYANLTSVDFIKRNEKFYEVQPIHEGGPLLSLLKEKAQMSSDHFFLDNANLPRGVYCKGRFIHPSQDLLEYRGDHLRASITACGGEQIYFELDKNGALVGSGNVTFQPVIRVKAKKSGQVYTIDLRNLFFTDLSANFQSPYEKNKDPKKMLEQVYRNLSLGIRDQESGHEQVLDLSTQLLGIIFKYWPSSEGGFQEVLEIKRPCEEGG